MKPVGRVISRTTILTSLDAKALWVHVKSGRQIALSANQRGALAALILRGLKKISPDSDSHLVGLHHVGWRLGCQAEERSVRRAHKIHAVFDLLQL